MYYNIIYDSKILDMLTLPVNFFLPDHGFFSISLILFKKLKLPKICYK